MPNSLDCENVILDCLVNNGILQYTEHKLKSSMSISHIFTFAPVPLTEELSPLAHAAVLIRRRQADNPVVAKPRHRIRPPADKPESVAA